MDKTCSEGDQAIHAKRITEGEIWKIVETGRENVNNNGVVYGVTDQELTEYSSQEIYNTAKQENGNGWVLVTRSSDGKKR